MLLGLNFPRKVNLSAAVGVGHSTNPSLFSLKIIKGYPIIKNKYGQRL